jgi:hypothetical protein
MHATKVAADFHRSMPLARADEVHDAANAWRGGLTLQADMILIA